MKYRLQINLEEICFHFTEISPDNKYIVTVSRVPYTNKKDKWKLVLFDFESEKEIRCSEESDGTINFLLISPDGNYLFTVSNNEIITVWDMEKLEKIRSFTQKQKDICSITITNNGKDLITGHKEGIIKFWNITTGDIVKELKEHKQIPLEKITKEGEKYYDTIQLPSQRSIVSLAVSSDERYLVSGSFIEGDTKRNIILWNLKSAKEIKKIILNRCHSLHITPDNYVVVDNGEEVSVYSIENFEDSKHYQHHNPPFSSVITPDGKYIVVSKLKKYKQFGTPDIIKLIDINNDKVFIDIHLEYNYMNEIKITPDSQYVFFTNDFFPVNIEIYEISSAKKLKSFNNKYLFHSQQIAISPNGKYAASGDGSYITLWDLQCWRKIKRYYNDYDSWLIAMQFTSDNKYILCKRAFEDSDAIIITTLDIEIGKEIKEEELGSDNDLLFNSHALIPNTQASLSCCPDGTINLYDKDNKELLKMIEFQDNSWISVTPNNFYTCSDDAMSAIGFFHDNELFEETHPIYLERRRECHDIDLGDRTTF